MAGVELEAGGEGEEDRGEVGAACDEGGEAGDGEEPEENFDVAAVYREKDREAEQQGEPSGELEDGRGAATMEKEEKTTVTRKGMRAAVRVKAVMEASGEAGKMRKRAR